MENQKLANILKLPLTEGYRDYINEVNKQLDNNDFDVMVKEVLLVLLCVVHDLVNKEGK